ncbi:unnamed protein product [Adineta ricciae]|uniref:G-protein coupled receptors family 1 profile domain-containing protein n=1 Tax=Adineta ricciae TaxID=249248 RepID=A0A814JXN0_ADIRI|nr:unnamed protein product [Adineta ricciae]CAF1355078.1 unnamed protein product [Adineta ricciae]
MSANSVNAFSIQFNRYASIVIFISGVIGNTLNIVVFTRPRLFNNPCSTYFFWSSIANISVLLFGLVSRFLSDGFGIDPVSNNLGFCRFRYYVLHSSMVLSSWLTILAGIDRYCISSRSAHRRQQSNLKNSRYLVAVTAFIILAGYSHALGLFTIEQLRTGPSCYAQAGTYRVFYDFFYFATYSFTPPIVMIGVGLATYYNIHQLRSHIAPMSNNEKNHSYLRKRDRQLLKMTLLQFICAVILTLPIAVQKLYATFTQNANKDTYQVAVENFIAQLMRLLVFINSSMGFYIFVFSGAGFRQETGQLIANFVKVVFGENSGIYRLAQNRFAASSVVQVDQFNQTATVLHPQSNLA